MTFMKMIIACFFLSTLAWGCATSQNDFAFSPELKDASLRLAEDYFEDQILKKQTTSQTMEKYGSGAETMPDLLSYELKGTGPAWNSPGVFCHLKKGGVVIGFFEDDYVVLLYNSPVVNAVQDPYKGLRIKSIQKLKQKI